MEEAVTRKFVHEDSSHIISFCGELVARGLEKRRFFPSVGCLGDVASFLEQSSHVILLLFNCEVIFGF